MKTKILRSELEALDPAERMRLVREGRHQIVDDPPRPKPSLPDGAMSRLHFNACDQAGRRKAVAEGRQIVDV